MNVLILKVAVYPIKRSLVVNISYKIAIFLYYVIFEMEEKFISDKPNVGVVDVGNIPSKRSKMFKLFEQLQKLVVLIYILLISI